MSAPTQVFQSHAGSIEAIEVGIEADDPLHRFNPTLVRLRLDVGKPRGGVGDGFQSHAGSIEA